MARAPRKNAATNPNPQIADPGLTLVDRNGQVLIAGADYAPEEAELDPTLKVLAELGAAGTGAFVNVYREPQQAGGKEAFLRKFNAAEFSLESLKASYGGGAYRVRGYRPRRDDEDGPNNMRLFCNESILIEEARDEVKPLALAHQPQQNIEIMFTRLAEMQMNGFKQLGELIVQARAPAATEDQIIDRLMKFKALFGGSSEGGFTPDRMMGFLQSVVGAATGMKELVGGGADKDESREPTDLDVLMKAMEMFGKPAVEAFMASRGQVVPALPAPRAAAPTPTPAASTTAVTATAADPGNDMNAIMKAAVAEHLKTLCRKAANDGDPGLYAELILDEVPADKLHELLDAPDWFDKLAAIEPNVKNYPGWFAELRTEIAALLTPEAAPATNDANPSGAAPAADVPQ